MFGIVMLVGFILFCWFWLSQFGEARF
uniref:Uncharacterized protein n=1 Tax=Rhizophora mucronata TaxID=61149 RepID=A0A2P2JBC8_RHIMU